MADSSLIEQLRCKIDAIEAGERSKPTHSCTPEQNNGAFSKIVALVNVSDRSEKTIRERLVKSGFADREIEDAIERAKRSGMIDDLRYADVLVRSRLNQGKGAVGIERELREHGIDINQVEGWPHGFGVDDETEYQRALALIEAHPSRSKNKREGAYRKLLSKGYSVAVASLAARTWAESL